MQSQPILDQTLESHLNTGRPLGSDDFTRMAEQLLGRVLGKRNRDQSQRIVKYCVPSISIFPCVSVFCISRVIIGSMDIKSIGGVILQATLCVINTNR